MRGFDPAFFTILAIRAPAKPWRANSAVADLRSFSRACAGLRRGRRAGNAANLTSSVASRSDMLFPIGEGMCDFHGEVQQGVVCTVRTDDREAERASLTSGDPDPPS